MENTGGSDIIKRIACIRTDFPEKFGIPRQASVVPELRGKIVFEPEYRNPDMLKGLEEFSHLWIIWQFSENLDSEGQSRWTPTVRPPRLGGNERKGVFATRSPFRPNPLGLSAVKIEKIVFEQGLGPVIYVLGADMVDRTPIYDIKPYIPYADSIPDAKGGFTDNKEYKKLKVEFETGVFDAVKSAGRVKKVLTDNSASKTENKEDDLIIGLKKILENDPRPHYQNDPERVYGMSYAGYEIKFRVEDDVLKVIKLEKNNEIKKRVGFKPTREN